MPPTYDAKITKKNWGVSKIDVGGTLRRLKVNASLDIRQKVGDLTYGECEDFATDLASATSKKSALSILEDHWNRCTLNTGVPGEKVQKTWKQRCEKEAAHTH